MSATSSMNAMAVYFARCRRSLQKLVSKTDVYPIYSLTIPLVVQVYLCPEVIACCLQLSLHCPEMRWLMLTNTLSPLSPSSMMCKPRRIGLQCFFLCLFRGKADCRFKSPTPFVCRKSIPRIKSFEHRKVPMYVSPWTLSMPCTLTGVIKWSPAVRISRPVQGVSTFFSAAAKDL